MFCLLKTYLKTAISFYFQGCDDWKVLDRCSGGSDNLSAPTSMSYTHHESIDNMYNVLGESIQSNIKQSPFFSFQIDEGTECSNLTTLMVYIRYFNESGVFFLVSMNYKVVLLMKCSTVLCQC